MTFWLILAISKSLTTFIGQWVSHFHCLAAVAANLLLFLTVHGYEIWSPLGYLKYPEFLALTSASVWSNIFGTPYLPLSPALSPFPVLVRATPGIPYSPMWPSPAFELSSEHRFLAGRSFIPSEAAVDAQWATLPAKYS